MEEEAEKLKQLQSEVDKQMNMGSPPGISKFTNLYFLSNMYKNKIYEYYIIIHSNSSSFFEFYLE